MTDELEAGVNRAVRDSGVKVIVLRGAGRSFPLSQLTAMKLVVNQAYANMGLVSTQLLGSSLLDGMLRNTPEALEFIELAEREGVPAAVARRDAPFGDYSQCGRPNPGDVLDVTAGWSQSAR